IRTRIWIANRSRSEGRLSREEPLDYMQRGLALHGGDALQERNLLGADLHAITGLAAVTDTAFFHEGVQAFFLERSAGGMIVEQSRLADHGGADEMIDRRVLGAGVEAASATDTARQGIALFLQILRNARASAHVVGAVDGDPGLDALEIVEEAL